jgi:hypothetical protein
VPIRISWTAKALEHAGLIEVVVVVVVEVVVVVVVEVVKVVVVVVVVVVVAVVVVMLVSSLLITPVITIVYCNDAYAGRWCAHRRPASGASEGSTTELISTT